MSLQLSHTTKTYVRLPYEKIKDDILGKHYELALNFVGEITAKKINISSRQKSYIPNVLSFPLTEDIGEIYITPAVVKREAKKFKHGYKKHTLFLFIHGLLHLKGYDHGDEMDQLEVKYLQKYS